MASPVPTTDLLRLRRIFREVFNCPELELTPATTQRDLEGWDSVAQIKLVLAVETEFGVRFEMEEVSEMRSVGEFLASINDKRSMINGKPKTENGTNSERENRKSALQFRALVVDLDNTLWEGLAGEVEEMSELRVTPEHAALQHYLQELHDRGVLLAVCSKNETAAAERPFAELPGMVLGRAAFAAFAANWRDKAENLAEIARTLHVGTDALLFLDDDPAERDWVRQRLPEVTVVEHDGTTTGMLAALRAGHYFDAAGLTAEDLARHKSFAADAALQKHLAAGRTLEEFLAGLEMQLEARAVSTESLERVAQLVNKTNQFNLTTRRRTAAEIAVLAESADWWCREFRLTDRFGEHGVVGVLLVEKEGRKNGRTEKRKNAVENQKSASENSTWRIDSWMLSCRVLGRRLEDAMFTVLAESARVAGAKLLVGEYRPTPKNGLVRGLYPRLGFKERSDIPGGAEGTTGGMAYQLELTAWRPPPPPSLRVATTGQAN